MEVDAILIMETYEGNDMGVQIPTESRTEIIGTLESVNRSEWAQVGQKGLNVAGVLKTNRVDYSGEKIVEILGVRYGIYRTFSPPYSDEIEIYLEEKAGV